MKKILIVSNKKNYKYAEMIANKLSKLKDNYVATTMNDDEYCNSNTKFSLHNFIVFVGPTKTTKKVEPLVNWVDRKCGIKYGTLGNKFFVCAENIDDETKFIEYATEKTKKYNIENLHIYDPKEYFLFPNADYSKAEDIIASTLTTIIASPLALLIKECSMADKVMSIKDLSTLLEIKYCIIIDEFLNETLMNSEFIEKYNDIPFFDKKILIVTHKNPDMFAEMLSALIYDSNSMIDVCIMDEEKYEHQHYQNIQKIVFINCKYAKKNIVIDEFWFKKWGMYYGYAGNRAVISCSNARVTKQNETNYEKFLREITDTINKSLENSTIKYKRTKFRNTPVGRIPLKENEKNYNKDIDKDLKNVYLIMEFFNRVFNDFMEE